MSEPSAEQPQPDAVTKVARDLTAIEDLACHLETQAVHKANDRDMPGGAAMVALGPVANLEAWQNRVDTALRQAYERGDELPEIDDEEDGEPVLQTLRFWSEAWRTDHGYDSDSWTISSEVNFIRWNLNWAWDNEPHFEDFARDIKHARTRLEDVLYDGERVERGVPCMYDECKGRRLTRRIDRYGERSKWRCVKCEREWDADQYARMVTAANEAAKVERIADEMWCSVDYASRDTGRSAKTIRTWINRGEVAVACILVGKRTQFVHLDEVRDRDERAGKRNTRHGGSAEAVRDVG